MHYYLSVLKKYAIFSGRAQRAEYWYFALFNTIVSILIMAVDIFVIGIVLGMDSSGAGILSIVYAIAVVLPSLAVTVRRLHDTGHSGWWFFICLVPLAGPIILFVFMVQDSKPGQNQFGPNPKGK